MGLGAWSPWLCGLAGNLPPTRIIIAPVVLSRGAAGERRSGVPPSRLYHLHCRSQPFTSFRPPWPKMRRFTRGGRCVFRVPTPEAGFFRSTTLSFSMAYPPLQWEVGVHVYSPGYAAFISIPYTRFGYSSVSFLSPLVGLRICF